MANKTTPAIQNLRGNIGIGTANPDAKLDVTGGSLKVESGDTFGFDGTHAAIYMDASNIGLSGKFGGSGYARNLIRSENNTIRIGENSSLISRILLDAGSSGVNGFISLQTKQSERVRIAADGNVGIGTTSPSYLLDVDGTLRLTNMVIRSGGFRASYNSYTQDALGQLTIQSGLGGLGEGGAADHFLFNAPDLYEVTTAQGGAYTDVTSTYAGTYKNLFTGQKNGVTVSNASIYSLRMTWDNIGYKWFDTLYVPCNFQGNIMDVTIEEYDGTNWNTVATRTGFKGYEGRNVYINAWNNASHQQKLRLTFDITWENSNSAQFYRIAYYGGYPAGSEVRLFTWNYDRNVSFNGSSVTIGNTLYLDNNEIWAKNSNSLNVKADSSVFIQPGASTTATFLSNGNVGIGTNTPAYKLQVKGTSATLSDGNQVFSVGNTTGGTQLAFGSLENSYNWIRSYESGAGGRDLMLGTNAEVMRLTAGGDVIIKQDLTVEGIVTAQEFHTEFVSASIIYQSGSTQFGDTVDDTHTFTGRVLISGDRISPYESEFPSADASLHIHTTASGTGVPFGDESKVVISTGAISAGDQGYLGSMWFGTSDYPAAGSPSGTGDQFNWYAAGIAATTAGADTGTGNVTSADLEFYTTDDSDTPSKRMVIKSDGNVGIGAASPSSILHIGGGTVPSTVLDGVLLSLSGNGQYYQAYEDGKQIFMGVDASSYGIVGMFTDHPLGFRTNNQERMRILANGNVGIGTTAPARELEVTGAGNVYIRVTAPTSTDSSAIELVNTAETWTIRNDDTNDNALEFQSDAGSPQVTMLRTGNVGIGTTSPGQKLHVVGNVKFDGSRDIDFNTQDGNIKITPNSGGWATGYYFNGSSSTFRGGFGGFGSDDTLSYYWIGDAYNDTTMVIEPNAGNVGIGTTSPSGKLEVNTGSTAAYFTRTAGDNGLLNPVVAIAADSTRGLIAASGDSMTFRVRAVGTSNPLGGTTVMSLLPNGNVGIGTTTPEQKLHVGAGHILVNRGIELRSKDTSGSERTITRVNSSNELEFGWSGAGPVKFMGGGSYAERMRIHTNGNVGIEDTSPSHRLTVSHNTAGDGGWINGIAIKSTSDTTGEAAISFTNTGTAGTGAGVYWIAGLNQSTTYKLAYGTSFTDGNTKFGLRADGGMRLNSYGSGTFAGTPTYNLQVDSSGNIIETAASAASTIGGSGVAEEVAVWSGTGNVSGSQAFTWNGDVLFIDGVLEAREKSFNIKHPTKENKRLIYGVLEGPEHGVYCRGKVESNVIELPEEWTGLVEEDSITVQLTSIGSHQNLYVADIKDNKVFIKNGNTFTSKIKAFYYIQGMRKDVKPLVTERDA